MMYPRKAVGVVCLITALAMLAGCQQSPQSVDADATNATQAQPMTKDVDQPAAMRGTAKAAAKKPVAMEPHTVAMKQDEKEPIVATISGCLEEDDGMFRLKDTDGEHAPKSRSWKSGFITKGSAKIDVFDAGNRFKLMSHVGNRVSVSGNLVDREMHARSVRVSSQRCD